MINFRQAIDDCDLTDLGSTGPFLTWNNRREGNSNLQERLDRFLADSRWRDMFGQAVVENLGFKSSDHRAILLRFKKEVNHYDRSHLSFRFEPLWLKEKDLGNVVKQVWDETGSMPWVWDLKSKLNLYATRLANWSNGHFKILASRLGLKPGILSVFISLVRRLGQCRRLKFWRQMLRVFLRMRSFSEKQRSRSNWLEAGDRNTKYFHARDSARKRKNNVDSLNDRAGQIQDSEEGMTHVVKDFFSDIFQSSNPSAQDISKATEGVRSRISEGNRREINAIFRSQKCCVRIEPIQSPWPGQVPCYFFPKILASHRKGFLQGLSLYS
ncbi:hypothetical protein Ddye_005008 [Dipteronia dyeriana]|uniref:Reverse transcriptase n=1 Tax=Dipteronia dyeriana TaxID=168575 RepID=A0AAD9XFP7_9ROSI|nr:hypothetical protein Ddye_005008 [Dipteronia dyeriana]